MTLTMQWMTMAVMLLSGLGMGAVFDGYRVVSNELKLPRWWLPVLDILYWMAAAVTVFRVLYASNNGELRAYVFIGLAIGVIIYYLLFSKIIVTTVKWLIRAVRAVLLFLWRCVEILLIKPILLLYRMLVTIVAFGSAFTIFLLKIMLQLIRPFWKFIVWMTSPIFRPITRRLKTYFEKWQLLGKLRKLYHSIMNWWSRRFRR